MKSDLLLVVTQLAAERNLQQSSVVSVVKAALSFAYRKDPAADGQDVEVDVDLENGEVTLNTVRHIVDEVEDDKMQLTVKEANDIGHNVKVGDYIITGTLEHVPGRIAAQTAKQVVLQKLREAERDLVFDEFADKEGQILTATIQRIESERIIVDLGKTEALMPLSEQSEFERYRPGQQLKFYVLQVGRTIRGPEIIVSRTHPDLLRRLFEVEVPEIFNNVVEIKSISREPGSRAKVAVFSNQEGVDAVGASVGLRGIRIQNVVNELLGEKIDVIEWNEDPISYIKNALSPSSVEKVVINQVEESALVLVPDKQLSLAIGRDGQNARLSARLTGWKIDIQPSIANENTIIEDTPKETTKTESREDNVDDGKIEINYENNNSETTDVSVIDENIDLELIALEQEIAELDKQEKENEKAKKSEIKEEVLDLSSDSLWEIGNNDNSSAGEIRFAEDIDEYDRNKPIRKTAADSRPAKSKRTKR